MAHVAKKIIAAAGLLLPHKNPGRPDRLEAVANVLAGRHFVEDVKSSRKISFSTHPRLGAAKFHQLKRQRGNDQCLTTHSASEVVSREQKNNHASKAPPRKRTKKRKRTSRSRNFLRKHRHNARRRCLKKRRRRKQSVQPKIEGQVDQTPKLITTMAFLASNGNSTPTPSSLPLDSQPPHVEATLPATIPLSATIPPSATIRSNSTRSAPLDDYVSLRGGTEEPKNTSPQATDRRREEGGPEDEEETIPAQDDGLLKTVELLDKSLDEWNREDPSVTEDLKGLKEGGLFRTDFVRVAKTLAELPAERTQQCIDKFRVVLTKTNVYGHKLTSRILNTPEPTDWDREKVAALSGFLEVASVVIDALGSHFPDVFLDTIPGQHG